jgi:hypothetical protein
MDMNPDQQLHKIEISLENAKKAIELANCLQRLHNNPDFQTVVLQDFFVDEASRAVLLLSDPSMQIAEKQQDVHNIIIGIGSLHRYFGKIYRLGEMSVRALEADQNTKEEILEEQLGMNELVQ